MNSKNSFVKRFFVLALIGLLACQSTGCSPEWRRKFVRKRAKPVEEPQAVLVLEKDPKAMFPAAVRYREHYAYWRTWHGELLISLGEIRKRDLRYLDGVIGELRSMQALLTGQPSQRMRDILVELSDLRGEWEKTPQAVQLPFSERTRLEKLQREITKKFHFSEIKDSIAPDPEPPQAPS